MKRSVGKRPFAYTLAALAIILLAVLLIWVLRLQIAERTAKQRLERAGLTAEFSIKRLSLKNLMAENVRIMRGGDELFAAKSVDIDFHLKGTRSIVVDSVELKRPQIRVEFDDNFHPLDPLFKRPSGSNPSAFEFPAGGIKIESGVAHLVGPFGSPKVEFDGQVSGLDTVSGAAAMSPAELSFGGRSGEFAFDAFVDVTSDQFNFDGEISALNLAFNDYRGRGVKLSGPLSAVRSEGAMTFTSETHLMAGEIESSDVRMEGVDLNWNGSVKWPQGDDVDFGLAGRAKFEIGTFSVTNEQRRKSLADRLTLNQTLSGLSSTRPFAAGLSGAVDDLLSETSISGDAELASNDAGHTISALSPILLRGGQTSVTISKRNMLPIYQFHYDTETVALSGHADVEGPYKGSFRDVSMQGTSSDGFRLSGVRAFTASLSTVTQWQGRTAEGRAARMRPMLADLSYRSDGARRELIIDGGIDFDGDIPGGYARGLRAKGLVSLEMIGENLKARFKSQPNRAVTVEHFLNVTEWEASDLRFTITNPVKYQRTNGLRHIEADLANGRGGLKRRADGLAFDVEFGVANLSADLNTAEQDWDIRATDTLVTSDIVPSPDTKLFAADLDMKVNLSADQPMQFTAETPSANVSTQLIKAPDIPVRATGTPEDLFVSYGPGRVKFSAAELPRLPLEGVVRYSQGAWVGDAVTYLPLANQTPVDVSYKFQDSKGSAVVKIDELPFTPDGLQPQYLVPALRGKVAEVNGRVSTVIDLEFGAGLPLKSSGSAVLHDIDFGTLPGPVTGVNAELHFSSFFPVTSAGRQIVTIDKFDPGFPLENGIFDFETVKDGVLVHSAKWPVGNGFITLDPTTWLYSAAENRMTLRVGNVDIGKLLENAGMESLKATGNVSGVLPVVISGVNVVVDGGEMRVDGGGTIQFESPQTQAAADKNQYAEIAFEALKDFRYRELVLRLNGPLDGEMQVYLVFDGANPDLLGGAEFLFRVNVEGELLNIARSFRMGQEIGAKILEQVKAQTRGNIPFLEDLDALEAADRADK